ncbi:MAG: acetyl-CoA C-acyltransferase [Chitinophagaceae bacterium]|nr:acetyl-CoA C-acyltransferase [Chitinophagaceae bacterium]
MKKAYIIDAGRTAIGKFGGALSSVRPDDLLAVVIREIIERNPSVDPALIEDVISGDANQAGEDNRNVARMSALLAGLPVCVAGNTVNRLCASGLQAVMDASRAVMCGDGRFYLAGGVESMSRAPYVMNKPDAAFSRKPEVFDTTIGWRFPNPKLSEIHHPYSMGETAENVASRWKITRAEQDAFALSSQEKYFKALSENKWKDEIIPVEVPQKKGESIIFSIDEHPRKTSMEQLSKLEPAFAKEGTVTAGNASGINDGAAMLLIADETAVKEFGLQPIAVVKSMAVAGVDPAIMGIGPVPATQKALTRAGLSVEDLGLIELNEAFASQSIACIRDLKLNPEIVNVNGGAIALGHPLGGSGARIATTLLYELKRRNVKYGLATMCVGVGQGAAMIFENYE